MFLGFLGVLRLEPPLCLFQLMYNKYQFSLESIPDSILNQSQQLHLSMAFIQDVGKAIGNLGDQIAGVFGRKKAPIADKSFYELIGTPL